MILRNSERSHEFTRELFLSLNVFSLQGLTVDEEDNFTAGIEAIQLESSELIDVSQVLPEGDIMARLVLTESLRIPLYFLFWRLNVFSIVRVRKHGDKILWQIENELNEKQFLVWWASLKKMKQTKPIYEAQPRMAKTVFDVILEKNGLAWGGNIDGYILQNGGISAIIENIYTARNPLNSPKGEPSYYFHSKGPNYNTWKPIILLANRLKVPLILLTFDANLQSEEKCGFTVINYLSTSGIYYKGPPPNVNIIKGLENIKFVIKSNLTSKPPYII